MALDVSIQLLTKKINVNYLNIKNLIIEIDLFYWGGQRKKENARKWNMLLRYGPQLLIQIEEIALTTALHLKQCLNNGVEAKPLNNVDSGGESSFIYIISSVTEAKQNASMIEECCHYVVFLS